MIKNEPSSFTCQVCGAASIKNGPHQKRCAPCNREFKIAYLREYGRHYYRRQREALGHEPRPAKPVRMDPLCRQCGLTFTRLHRSKRFCSVDCSSTARRLRDKEKKKETRKRPKTPEQVAKAKARWTAVNRSTHHREYIREYERKRHENDPKFAVNRRMKALVAKALREKKAGRSWQELVGYSIDDLMAHLERQFTKGMSWENRAAWHIDHIRPVSSFSFVSAQDAEFRDCWSLYNLRPMFASANIKKGGNRTLLI